MLQLCLYAAGVAHSHAVVVADVRLDHHRQRLRRGGGGGPHLGFGCIAVSEKEAPMLFTNLA
jgi:hypothetical protein